MSSSSPVSHFLEHGYVILSNLLTVLEITELITALEPYEVLRPHGRTDFEGTKSKRVYSLAGKGNGVFMRLVAEHPAVLNVLDELLFNNYLLSTFQSIRLEQGEKAQEWHTDDAFYGLYSHPRPGTLAVSTIWALEDFTLENGATEIIPRSQVWGLERPEMRQGGFESMKVVMPAGSCVLYDGALWHRGGQNKSNKTRLALSPQYCQPWLRTQESQLLIVPPHIASTYSQRSKSLLGYSIHPPFLGQVDGMHPTRLCDPNYALAKTHDADIANMVLKKPKSAFL